MREMRTAAKPFAAANPGRRAAIVVMAVGLLAACDSSPAPSGDVEPIQARAVPRPEPRTEGFRFETVTDGIFVALQPHDGRFNDCNVTVIVEERGVTVVDAPSDGDFTRDVIDAIRAHTDRPVVRVINTHWHGDHTQGNALFREAFGDDVDVIGHVSLIEDVPGRAATAHAERVTGLAARIEPSQGRAGGRQGPLGAGTRRGAARAPGRGDREHRSLDRSEP